MSGAAPSVTRARTSYPAAAEARPNGRRRHRITQLAAIAGGSHARYVIAVIYGYRRRIMLVVVYHIELLYLLYSTTAVFWLWYTRITFPSHCFGPKPGAIIYNLHIIYYTSVRVWSNCITYSSLISLGFKKR